MPLSRAASRRDYLADRPYRKVWRFAAVLLAALSMALSIGHLLQMPARLEWDAALWLSATGSGGLYRLHGGVGMAIDLITVLALVGLALLEWQRRIFGWLLAGTVLFIVALAMWWLLVFPADSLMANWQAEVEPFNFFAVRDHWEYSQAGIACVKLAGFALLLLALVLDAGRPSSLR